MPLDDERGLCRRNVLVHGVERPIYNINSASDAKKRQRRVKQD